MDEDLLLKHGYTLCFRLAADAFYSVEDAIYLLESPVPEGHKRWRCILCGWPVDVNRWAKRIIGASGCGGCGMTTLRSIEEWGGQLGSSS